MSFTNNNNLVISKNCVINKNEDINDTKIESKVDDINDKLNSDNINNKDNVNNDNMNNDNMNNDNNLNENKIDTTLINQTNIVIESDISLNQNLKINTIQLSNLNNTSNINNNNNLITPSNLSNHLFIKSPIDKLEYKSNESSMLSKLISLKSTSNHTLPLSNNTFQPITSSKLLNKESSSPTKFNVSQSIRSSPSDDIHISNSNRVRKSVINTSNGYYRSITPFTELSTSLPTKLKIELKSIHSFKDDCIDFDTLKKEHVSLEIVRYYSPFILF